MIVVAGIAAVMVDHFFLTVLADLPSKSVFAGTRERRFLTDILCISRVRRAEKLGWYDLFAAKLTVIHIHVEPAAYVRNARKDTAGRLHRVVLFRQDRTNGLSRCGVE